MPGASRNAGEAVTAAAVTAGCGVSRKVNHIGGEQMKTYTFHVSLPGHGRAWRKIEMRADQTLEDLHFAIQEAYGWDADHLYSFFMSGRA